VVSVLARKGRCERASIDEVYLDLTDAAETMLAETPLEGLEVIDEEAVKSHILGLNNEVRDSALRSTDLFFIFINAKMIEVNCVTKGQS
jgi:nucleotidyltransferase/DNA polymerase involved in DNA repair